jgi:hypothetical protein
MIRSFLGGIMGLSPKIGASKIFELHNYEMTRVQLHLHPGLAVLVQHPMRF